MLSMKRRKGFKSFSSRKPCVYTGTVDEEEYHLRL